MPNIAASTAVATNAACLCQHGRTRLGSAIGARRSLFGRGAASNSVRSDAPQKTITRAFTLPAERRYAGERCRFADGERVGCLAEGLEC